uniref:non-specific serine/threonine protein kinase n=2 Tax=Mycobacterium avium TaxID=1764 RepID=A0A187NFL9_MYCAV|nr:serine/threonine protein kinase [Mycobacterium avium subsp. hominissuis]
MALTEGAQFAGYTIVRQLGSGGMGEVYLVRHPRFPRLEALKVLRADLSANTAFQQRFNREAELAGGLWHPHIIGVHDRGEFEGQLWITMDYVEGTDLAALVAERYVSGLPTHLVLAVVSAVGEALDYAHHRGLLHRDVKPANIMITQPEDGSAPRVLLSDFGIARPIDDPTGLTQTNMALGTVNYSAPEQLMAAAIDGRADQYSLAATAYYLLTGTKMYANLPAVAVISAHLTAAPPLPGATRPDLVATDPVFARALAKDPAQRFARCADFAAALQHQLQRTQPTGHTDAGPGPLTAVGVGPNPLPDNGSGHFPTPAPGDPTQARPGAADPGSGPAYLSAPAPASPSAVRRRRRVRIAAGAAVVAAAALTAYLAIPRGGTGPATSTGAQAKDAALQTGRHYLEALSGGDAAGALRLSATAPSTTQWVTADALHAQLAAAPITNIAVTSAPSAPSDNPNDVQYVLLSAQIGPTLSQARVAVRRHGDDWKLDNTTVPVDLGTPGVDNAALKAVALSGVPTNGTSPIAVFPGALVVSSSNRFVDISAQAPPVLLNELTATADHHPRIEPNVTLNATGLQAAKAAVDNWEHHCYHGVAPPPECNALNTSDTTVSTDSPGDFSQTQFSLDPTTMLVTLTGTVTYSARTASNPHLTVIYKPAGRVDLSQDPPTYSGPSNHR